MGLPNTVQDGPKLNLGTVPQVAALLGVKQGFVYRHGRELPGLVRLGGRALRWDLDVLASSLKAEATGKAADHA